MRNKWHVLHHTDLLILETMLLESLQNNDLQESALNQTITLKKKRKSYKKKKESHTYLLVTKNFN